MTTKKATGKAALFVAGLSFWGMTAQAQTSSPIVLPNTFTTVAGSANGNAGASGFTAGAACSPGSPYKATDVYGDGCLATQAVFGTDLQDGVRVDGQGNLWIADLNNNWAGTSLTLLRRVDSRSGIVSLVSVSTGSNCAIATASSAGSMDSQGDGCAFANSKAPKERGWGMDPYGNLFTGSYGSGEVHLYCNAVSPLCPIAAGVTQTYSSAQKQVGNVYRIAGCVGTGAAATSGTSLTSPGAGDGYFASSFWNLPGDIAAWGASNSSFSAIATATGTTGTCGPTTGGINGARGVAADQYGNIYISDGTNLRVRVIVGPPTFTLANGTVLTNPLPAVIALYPTYSSVTAAQMYGRIYPIVGGFTATVANSACPSASTATAVDAFGDGCPWFNTAESNANPVGLAIDQTIEGGVVAANSLFLDGALSGLRVLYMGPTVSVSSITPAGYPMANAIFVNNPALSSVTHGYVYLLAGNSTGAITAAPSLGTQTSMSGFGRLAAAPNGNLYLSKAGTSPSVALYDLSTGYVRVLAQSTGTVVTASVIPPGTTSTAIDICSTPGAGDGQPAFATSSTYSGAALTTNSCFNDNGTGSSTLSVAADSKNNLYLGDVEIDTSGYGRSRVREVIATQLLPATIGTPVTQSFYLHGPAGTTAGATALGASVLNVSSSEINVATPTCATTANADKTVDCLATVTFSPAAPGLRAGILAISDPSPSAISDVSVAGVASGAALVSDPVSPIAPITTTLTGIATVPAGVAVDANGDIFTMDTAAGKFIEITGSAVTTLPGTLPANPTQMAIDLAGNLYAVGVGNAKLSRLTLTGAGYVADTVSIGGVAAPQAVAFDPTGNLYVADKTTASVYKVAVATLNGATLPSNTGPLPTTVPPMVVATGLGSPTSLAIDSYGNLYIGDSGAGSIFRVDAKAGTLSTLIQGIHPVSVAVDAAGDVYYQDSTTLSVVEIPYTGISNGASGSTFVTVLASLKKPSGLAIAGNGNAYSADSGAGALTLVSRNAFAYNFGVGSSGTPTVSGTLTDAGNLASTGTNPNVNTTNLVLSSSGSNGCPISNGIVGPQAAGNACTFNANFVGQGSGSVSSVISYLPAASSVGSLALSGTLTSISGTTISLAPLSSTVLPGATIVLTATVASTAAVAGETVTFLNGAAVLGTGTTNASGVASYSLTAGPLGTTYVFQATFAGTALLGASASPTQTVTVALAPSVITLALSTASTYPTQPVTLTATQTPAAVGQVITFLNGMATIGTGTINAAGVATYVYTPTSGGTYTLTASFASDGKAYAASVSQAQTLVVAAGAVSFGVSPGSITVAPGTSGMVTLSISPQGGFNGVTSLSCSSPVAYVTCALQFTTVAVGADIPNPTATITVAPTTGALHVSGDLSLLALLTPFGLVGFALVSRKRSRRLPRVAVMLILAVCGGMVTIGFTGCTSSSTSASKGTAPSGTQVVTFKATAGGGSQTATVTVTIG